MTMGPGLNRAVPMALAGFLLGALFVIVLRIVQSIEPVWDAQLGLLMAAFLSTVFFVWGMGAFNARLAEHHIDEPPEFEDEASLALAEVHESAAHDAHHDDEEAAEAQPTRLLSAQVWQIAFWTVLLFVAIFAFATLPGGFALTISNDAAVNRFQTGMIPLQIPFTDQVVTYNGEVVLFSELVLFLIFAGFTLLSLAAIGGIVALGFFGLSRGVATVKAQGNVPLYALTGGATAPALPSGLDAPAQAAAPVRPVSERARAFTAPNLLNFAVLFPNVYIGLWLFSILDVPARITLAIILSFLLSQVINNNLIPGKGKAQQNPTLATLLGVVALVAGWVIFQVLLSLAIQFTGGWQYAPLDPTRDALPWASAAFLAPFIVDLLLNGAAIYGGLAKAIRLWVVTMLVFQVLYIVFYGPAIGLVILGDPGRFIVSAINTAVVALLLLRTAEVTWCLGRTAGWAANLLLKLPAGLGQK